MSLKMFYTIYKITNTSNNKFYIGAHKTSNLDDGYMGSGSDIKKAIKRYGLENFTKEILHVFDSPDEMFNQEKILLEGVWNTPSCYNKMPGGYGGGPGSAWAENNKNAKASSDAGNNKLKELWQNDTEWAESVRLKMSTSATNKNFMKGKIHIHLDGDRKIIDPCEWPKYEALGWHSLKSKQSKMKRRWVNNGSVNLLVASDEYMDYINSNWKSGRFSK